MEINKTSDVVLVVLTLACYFTISTILLITKTMEDGVGMIFDLFKNFFKNAFYIITGTTEDIYKNEINRIDNEIKTLNNYRYNKSNVNRNNICVSKYHDPSNYLSIYY